MSIFIEIENVLVDMSYSLLTNSTKDKIKTIKFDEESPLCYTTLRPGALEFLNNLRRKTSNVFMLTSLTKTQAVALNRLWGFGFFSDQIYSRELIINNINPNVYSPKCCLIDVLPQKENRMKLFYLRSNCLNADYIQASNYSSFDEMLSLV